MFNIAKVVIGENKTLLGGEKYLKERGLEVVVFDNECKELMDRFIKGQPEIWYASFSQKKRGMREREREREIDMGSAIL